MPKRLCEGLKCTHVSFLIEVVKAGHWLLIPQCHCGRLQACLCRNISSMLLVYDRLMAGTSKDGD
jgi:hypothetical protein